MDRLIKFSGKKCCLALHLIEMDTDPDPAPDRQALDADADPARIGIHNTSKMRIRMVHNIQYIAQGMRQR